LSIEDVVRERGPLTVAAFMDLALYDPEFGYYARAARRSGRAGDFFTSVDVGAVFGQLLAVQIHELAGLLTEAAETAQQAEAFSPSRASSASAPSASLPAFDLIEAGAGNGRLSADILGALRSRNPDVYNRLRLHLVEASPQARLAQRDILADLSSRLVASSDSLPESYEGVLVANELLDAMVVHQVVMRQAGLREVYVSAADGRLTTVEGPPSTPALENYLARLGITLEAGWRAEINLQAVQWVHEAARRLRRGFLVIIDYGHEARDLYSVSHATGTLTTFSNHTMGGPELRTPRWLEQPGEQDLTAHVDFTSVRAAAEAEGLVTLGFMDQTYFLLGLIDEAATLTLSQRLALKTLTMPGGLGSTHKVLILGKGVGAPSLRGCSFGQRVT